MGPYEATVSWKADDGDFSRGKYSRRHTWSFDGGVTVPASANPGVVRPPYGDPACVDPEEALVAAISSCHMLTFLDVARRAGFVVLSYDDAAVGSMERNEAGVPWVHEVVLRPHIVFAPGKAPDEIRLAALHDESHHKCFIAQSVKTHIRVERRKDL
jgi:organic hydroperoxide reductase OsmC/OhrA